MEIPVLREGRNVMKAISVLPEDYAEICAIDLQKNKKLMLLVNLIAVLMGLGMAVPMFLHTHHNPV